MNSTNVKGELQSSFTAFPSTFQVTLEDPSRSSGWVANAESTINGAFEFRGVPYGAYWLKVKNEHGETVKEEFVIVSSATPAVSIRLPEARLDRPSAARISVRQLQNPPSRKAVKALLDAQRLSAAAQPAKAAEKLQEAIRESPEYAEAHSNLAAQKMRLQLYEEGLREAALAMEIAGATPLDLTNTAFGLGALGRYQEAIACAREALLLDGGYMRAHLLLGQLLARRVETLDEALRHLDRAAEEIPSARPVAAHIRAGMASRRD